MELWAALWKEIEKRIVEEGECKITAVFIEEFCDFLFRKDPSREANFYRVLKRFCEEKGWRFLIRAATPSPLLIITMQDKGILPEGKGKREND